MDLLKTLSFLFILSIGMIPIVTSECSRPFLNGDERDFCYYLERRWLSWSEGLNQCLDEGINGVLIEVKTKEQFYSLQTINLYGKKTYWLGANNFASFADSKWHWIDGSIVESSVVTWCPNSTHDVAIGTQCAAYDPNLQCITNYLCSTALPAPCVPKNLVQQSKMSLASRAITSALCTNSYGGAYANWWTYSMILLNWFILFCFGLYLTNRLNLNKRLVIVSVIIVLISFMMIIAFAIIWGVQYEDLRLLPLIVVILGCIGCLLFIVKVFILVLQRIQIQRSMLCAIVTGVTFIIELGLMIGLILCVAHCSGYITFGETRVEKDIIGAILAAITTAISIIFYNLILFLIGHVTQDRIHVMQSNNPIQAAAIPLTTGQPMVPRRSENNNNNLVARKSDRVERATSPVDQRILNEFYGDRPKDIHTYQLDGRQYLVYEGKTFSDIDSVRKDLTEAMLLQEPQGLRDAIVRARNSPHASSLTQEIRQAEDLLNRIS